MPPILSKIPVGCNFDTKYVLIVAKSATAKSFTHLVQLLLFFLTSKPAKAWLFFDDLDGSPPTQPPTLGNQR